MNQLVQYSNAPPITAEAQKIKNGFAFHRRFRHTVTKAVNRRERAPQQTSAVLKFTVIQRHMVDRLHNQATHRSDGKQPEDIEKVQRNIALAGLVAA